MGIKVSRRHLLQVQMGLARSRWSVLHRYVIDHMMSIYKMDMRQQHTHVLTTLQLELNCNIDGISSEASLCSKNCVLENLVDHGV